MTKCDTDCVVIQEAMQLDESEIERFIEFQKKFGAECADCEHNDLREERR